MRRQNSNLRIDHNDVWEYSRNPVGMKDNLILCPLAHSYHLFERKTTESSLNLALFFPIILCRVTDQNGCMLEGRIETEYTQYIIDVSNLLLDCVKHFTTTGVVYNIVLASIQKKQKKIVEENCIIVVLSYFEGGDAYVP